MVGNGVGETGAEFYTLGFGHGAKDIKADGFGYVVKEQHPNVSAKRDSGLLRFILTQT
jgi:hypothetical protein